MTQNRRPTTPPPFPTPAQLSQQKAEADDPAVTDLMRRVHEVFKGRPNAQGEYAVYMKARDTEAVVVTVSEQLDRQGWQTERRPGMHNDPDLIISAKQ